MRASRSLNMCGIRNDGHPTQSARNLTDLTSLNKKIDLAGPVFASFPLPGGFTVRERDFACASRPQPVFPSSHWTRTVCEILPIRVRWNYRQRTLWHPWSRRAEPHCDAEQKTKTGMIPHTSVVDLCDRSAPWRFARSDEAVRSRRGWLFWSITTRKGV